MKVGYIRVSTKEQNTIRQEALMLNLGVEKIYIDIASGKTTQRKELENMLDFVRDGDIVIVESYSRIARNTRDLIDIINTLEQKNVKFVSKKEDIDTSTPAGRLMITMFAGVYQFERECMIERIQEGIQQAKLQGKYKGRKPIEIDKVQFNKLYKEWKKGNITAVAMRKKLNLKKTTFYQRVQEYEKNR